MLIFSAAVLCGALLLCPQKKNEPSNTLTDLATEDSADLTISTVAELQAFATNVNNGTTYAGLTVALNADLDLSGVNWASIGYTSARAFSGTFDGRNHTIKNLTVNTSTSSRGSLFGLVQNGTIKNLTIYNPVITATSNNTGPLIGYMRSTTANGSLISNCHVIGGSITATSYTVGGLVGYIESLVNNGTYIENCTVESDPLNNYAPTVVSSNNTFIGGLIGAANGLKYTSTNGVESAGIHMTLCSSTATVKGTVCIGGIIGFGGGCLIDQCYSSGAVTGAADIGGIVGYDGNYSSSVYQAIKITNCIVTGDVTAAATSTPAYAGGIIGNITGAATSYIENCLVTGDVLAISNWASTSGHATAAGILGLNATNTAYVGGCIVASQRISAIAISGSYAFPSPFANGWPNNIFPTPIAGSTNYYNEDILISARKGGTVAYTTSITGNAVSLDTLKTLTPCIAMGWDSNIWTWRPGINDDYPVLRNLDVPEQPLGSRDNPILINTPADFKEMSDNVNSGKNLYASQHLLQTADLNLAGIGRTGSTYTLSFQGNYDGGEHSMTNVSISEASDTLALFGFVVNASFRNIIVENATVYSTKASGNWAGILVAATPGNLYMENCAVVGGSVIAPNLIRVGALCGYCNYNGNYFVKCFSSAAVSGGANVGGLIGGTLVASVSQCYNKGDVSGTISNNYSTGGIIGNVAPLSGYYVYDSATELAQTTVTNCYAKCTVTDSHTGGSAFAGGIIGFTNGSTTVSNCYYQGTINAENGYSSSTVCGAHACGIVGGSNIATVYVKNCLSVPTFGSIIAKGKWLQVGYFNTYYSAKPADSENGYFIETILLDPRGGSTPINNGTAVTLAQVTDCSVFAADKLGWDMNDIWSQDPAVNGGFPILRGLLVDTSELSSLLAKAKTYKESDWSKDTYSPLAIAISNAESDLRGKITEEQVAKDIAALQTAISGLRADKLEFETYYNKVVEEVYPYKDYYTNFSVVESLLNGAKIMLDDDTGAFRNSDIQAVYNALQTAVANLRIDKSELNNAIEEANALKSTDYPEEDFEALKEALHAAVAVYNNDKATAADVIEATEALKAALARLQLDKTQIAEAIIAAYDCIGVKAIYNHDANVVSITDDSNQIVGSKFENYAPFQSALEKALLVQADNDATSREIQDAIFDLNVALNALSLDKKPLQTLYYTATALNAENYTQESFARLAAPMREAETALQYYDSRENFKEISKYLDDAYAHLDAALKALELNKTELYQLIQQAELEKNVSGIYTTETWDTLQTVLAKAQKVYEDSAATQEDIHSATVNLADAIQNLELNLQYLNDLIDDATDILNDDSYSDFYLGDSLAALKSAKEAAEGVVNSSSKDIDAVKQATRNLQNALDALKVDLSQLEDYIDRVNNSGNANYIDPEVYAADGIKALKDLAEETQDLLDSNAYTDEQIIAYTLRFEALFDDLKPNKDPLTALVRDVSTWTNTKYRQDNDDKWIEDENGNLKVFVIYRTDTWSALQDALGAANRVILNNEATVEEVVAAKKTLENAVLGLSVDTSELEDRMAKAEGLLEKKDSYTDSTIAVLQAKYDAAKKLLTGSTKLELDDVQQCLDELVDAINGLLVDKQKLLDLVAEAEDLLQYKDYYTSSSYSNFTTQLNLVKSNVDNDNLDETDISHLYDVLSAAISALVIVTDDLDKLLDRFDQLEEEFVAKESYELISGLAKDARDMLSGEFTVEDYLDILGKLGSAFDSLKPNTTSFKEFIDDCKDNLNLSYTDESVEKLQEQIDSAMHVYNGEALNDETGEYESVEITYDDVIASVEALRNAVLGLQPKKNDLQDLVDQTKEKMDEVIDDFGEDKKVSECYTAESYDELDEALQNGYLVLADESASLDDVNNAIAQINAAIEALVIDKTPLQALIKVCDELYLEEYFEEAGFTVFKAQLTQSKADVEDDDISLDDFIASYNNLLQAKEALVFSTDALEKIIAVAEGKEQANYTVGSFQELAKDLQAAKDYLDSEEKDSDTYNEVCGNLLEAIGELVSIVDLVKEIDAVQEFVDKGNELDTENGVYYSDGSFKAVEDLVAEANILKNLPDPTQAEVDDMIARLKDYQSLLLNVFDAKQFSNDQHDFIDDNEEEYSDRTWSAYTDALDELDSLLAKAKDEVTLEDLDKAMDAVTEAKEALKLASEDTETGLLEVIESNNTFKFIYGDGTELDFKTHTYNEDKPVYLTNIALGDSLADIIAQFVNKDITAYDAEGKEITDLSQVVATGIVLKIFDGDNIIDEITLVLRGDVNGDGKISVQDKIQLNAYTGGTIELDIAYQLACDINGDGKISVQDKIQLNAYTGGTIDLYAGLSVKQTSVEQ